MRRRSSSACCCVICAVLTVPVGSPVAVPSGMRSSRLRGGGGAAGGGAAGACFVAGGGAAVACFVGGGCEPVFDAVEEAVDETVEEVVADVTGKPVAGLMPGGVSDSGAGVVGSCAGGAVSPLRRASRRRFALVEMNPVVPAPEPGALA